MKDTQNMEDLLPQLKEKLGNAFDENEELLYDGFLKRWIHGRGYNLNHAAKGIIKTLKWRTENKIDGIINESFDDVFQPFEYSVEGYDVEKRPVIIVEVSQQLLDIPEKDIKKRIKAHIKNKERSTRFVFSLAETLQNLAKNSKNADGIIVIDMKGIEIKSYIKHVKSVLPMVMELMDVCELHYPSIVHSVYILNSPKKSLKLLMGFVSPTVAKEAEGRVHIYGRKMEKWKKALLELLPEDQLSIKYGGTKSI